VRPDKQAPSKAEGRGSWAGMVRCFQQSMSECIKYMTRDVGINAKQNNQEHNTILFGRLDGSGNTKRGFWACFSDKSRKTEEVFVGWKGRP
jgi:hypothetical protein